MESILQPSTDRLCIYPIKHTHLFKLYKTHVAQFWTPEEMTLTSDKADFDRMAKDEQYFISMILAFFSQMDGVISENLSMRFSNEVQIPEARLFYGIQNFAEGIHNECYSILIDTFITNKEEKKKYLNSVNTFPVIKMKYDWANKWIQSNESFAKRLVAFACIEGISFSGAFASIYYIKKRGLMAGLTFVNELISIDEALHTEFAVALYHKLEHPLTQPEIHTIIKECVDIEIEFVCEALPCRLIGMNQKTMGEYIMFVADRLALQLGCDKLYNTKNPFDFMELISVESKANFFEKKVSSYALADKTVTADTFTFDSVF